MSRVPESDKPSLHAEAKACSDVKMAVRMAEELCGEVTNEKSKGERALSLLQPVPLIPRLLLRAILIAQDIARGEDALRFSEAQLRVSKNAESFTLRGMACLLNDQSAAAK